MNINIIISPCFLGFRLIRTQFRIESQTLTYMKMMNRDRHKGSQKNIDAFRLTVNET